MRVLRGCVSTLLFRQSIAFKSAPHDLVYRAFMMDSEQARNQNVRIAAAWSKGK